MPTSQTSKSRTQTVALANWGVSADMLSGLHQFALDLVARRDLSDLLAHAILTAAQLTASPHATLLLLDPAGKQICYRVALDNGNLAPLELIARPMMQKGLAGWVARERRAALVRDTLHDSRWLPAPGLGDLRSALVAPIVQAERVLGVMTLGHELPYHYHPEHLNLLEILCAPIGLALALARFAEAAEPAEPPHPAGITALPRLQALAEERDMLALAAELRGLSAAAAALDSAAGFDDIVGPFFQTAAAIVERHGGSVVSIDGDTLLALFAAERTIGAACAADELHNAGRHMRSSWQLRYGVKTGALDIGLAAGLVTLGTIAVAQPLIHAAGAAITLARRLRELARGEILISDRVAQALAEVPGFAVDAQPPLYLRTGPPQTIFQLRARPPGAPAADRSALPAYSSAQ